MKTKNLLQSLLLNLLGIVCCVIPPALCILYYFPIWVAEGGERIVSGITLLLLALAIIPLYKFIKRALRSAASYTLWLIAFLVFLLLAGIAEEMTVISFFGFVGNLMGALFFKMAKRTSDCGEPDYEM